MCESMRKPTGSLGIDDFTQKRQTLYRSLAAIEEGDTFGDSDEESLFADPVPAEQDSSDSGMINTNFIIFQIVNNFGNQSCCYLRIMP